MSWDRCELLPVAPAETAENGHSRGCERLWIRAISFAFTIAVAFPAFLPAQQFLEKVYRDEQGEHRYTVVLPAGYSSGRKFPAVLFLHGAGERGTDGKLPTTVGMGPYIKAWGSRFPSIAVFPQAEQTRGRLLTPWQAGQPDAERALKILEETQKAYSIDSQRIALVGWSMGGYGAWSLGAAQPQRWAGIAALSGGGDPAAVAALNETPVWAFHGSRDHLVPAGESRKMVEALKAAGGKVAFEEFPESGHDIFAESFGNEAFIAWLSDPRTKPMELSKRQTVLRVEPPPFVPALNIPQAVGIRLGNEALEAMSYAAPSLVPAGMLSGSIGDMFDSTSAQGRSFSVRFSGISYRGQLERVVIKAIGRDRVRLQLGVRNVTLTIAGTSVTGARHAAQAGPIAIGIGHNRPVWMTLEVVPYIDNGQLRLRLLGTGFSIPPDSYYVTQPAGVSVQGFGMTREAVVNGLVGGLYGARNRVENEVRNIAPNILRQMESALKITDAGPIIAGMWPLPVFPPRLRAYPQQVATDEQGISLVMGVTAAAVPGAKPKPIVTTAPVGVTLSEGAGRTSLSVAIAPQVLGPLTQQLIDADLARIDLLDLPEPSFHELSQRPFLQTVLPDLARFDERLQVRSELVLASPLGVTSVEGPAASGADENALPLRFQLPQTRIEVSIKPDPQQAAWQPYAQFDVNIDELVAARLDKPTHDRRILEMRWQQDRTVTGTARFADGAEPTDRTINSDEFVAQFRKRWENWTQSGAASRAIVPDVQFAQTRLRLQDLGRSGAILTGDFRVPTVKVTNLSEVDFSYQTKGPFSDWSTPYHLKPGKSHEFLIPYPLTYRHTGGAGREVYTLITGSHSEYRVPKTGGPPRLFQAREPVVETRTSE